MNERRDKIISFCLSKKKFLYLFGNGEIQIHPPPPPLKKIRN